ncbi:hypothetical protein [Lacihabitans soyangensis]|uniref:Uncharacterized protein n=1 Tax=Lacihabitans soyangensis TaxID=869394 RepID=A0AAE3KX05_9BACT|nr:hypothetical protein [Lacihabitans soyangensis]MCP9763825.1 hypothetical protein [Lacihabitans soyangensis]
MGKYLMVCGHELVDKNKLDAALKEWFKKEDRRVFESEDEIKRFVAETKAVCQLENPRCKEIPIYAEWDYEHKKDLIVRGGMGLSVDFFAFEDKTASTHKKNQETALKVITENFMIHRVEELEIMDNEVGVPELEQIEVKYRFFGKIGEAQYVATKLDEGLSEAFISLTMDNELMESLEDQIEEHEEGILQFLKAWVEAYNEGLAEDEAS